MLSHSLFASFSHFSSGSPASSWVRCPVSYFHSPLSCSVLSSMHDSPTTVGLCHQTLKGRNLALQHLDWTPDATLLTFIVPLDWMNGNPVLNISQLLSQKGFCKILIHVSVVDTLTVESLLIHASWLRKEHVVSQLYPGFPHIYTH